jgi:hypothetical protein
MWFVWMSIGTFIGVVIMCVFQAGKRADCINCQGIMDREADIRTMTRSRDLFRDRYEQELGKANSLRIKLGIKNHKEGVEFYKRLGVV